MRSFARVGSPACTVHAGVVELVDTLDLGSSGASHGGSSPFARTSHHRRPWSLAYADRREP
ncbi:hypothetical protein amb2794 [Paramagnetospirillum magneticum AMB-1]|uniref:Uncharacterized protein n=1 Tax=Paramagnetospirillum magneticum (strain ATCC 700264 / AMB-1) TaxID=342108 RepID=Q2W3H7_PARM1|nr:hypothetical protein amb2794 [Paramagnetospirillum magneticum AMB-1]